MGVEQIASQHRVLKAALAIPTFAVLAAASYAVHGSVVAVGMVYGSLLRRRRLNQAALPSNLSTRPT
jgi:hypothetical protein